MDNTITRVYRVITDDDASYVIQRRYLTEEHNIPTPEDDITDLLAKRFVAVNQYIFIPTNKIKKIILLNSGENDIY